MSHLFLLDDFAKKSFQFLQKAIIKGGCTFWEEKKTDRETKSGQNQIIWFAMCIQAELNITRILRRHGMQKKNKKNVIHYYINSRKAIRTCDDILLFTLDFV